ncbi:hypothetical protein ACR80S_15680 [Halomonas sp. MA07-2]|uniref:hypothetical protein n=1 Tax=unclassified Halomonas TaxID=2609666 RepID=UPI003EEA8D8C
MGPNHSAGLLHKPLERLYGIEEIKANFIAAIDQQQCTATLTMKFARRVALDQCNPGHRQAS